jgi:purine-binding chemotaxis protein CheW
MSASLGTSILRERARLLAREAAPAIEAAAPVRVVAFRVAAEQYAIETTYVKQVYRLKSLAPLPHTARFLLGVTNLRGRIVPVVDLKKFFDLPDQGLSDLNRVVVVAREPNEAGILADEVIGERIIDSTMLTTNLPTHEGIRTQFLRGVTPAGLIVLDGNKLIADQRLLGIVHGQKD